MGACIPEAFLIFLAHKLVVLHHIRNEGWKMEFLSESGIT